MQKLSRPQQTIIQLQQLQPDLSPDKDFGTPNKILQMCQKSGLKIQAYELKDSSTKHFRLSKNGFLDSFYLAYSHHMPLQISPDDIWLIILQGLSKHINLNSANLKQRFVNFDGKKTLRIRRDQFKKGNPDNEWKGCFKQWSQKIKQNIGQNNYQKFITKFSTTDTIAEACFHLTLMDAMKQYFEYRLLTKCGIPKVKLTGNIQDWQKIYDKFQQLQDYGLQFWVKPLSTILQKFIKAKKGQVDKQFWDCCYKITAGKGSGAVSRVQGWALNFFPYTKQNKFNEQLKTWQQIKSMNSKRRKKKQETYSKGLDQFQVPASYSYVPFIWQYIGAQIKMQIMVGIPGICWSKDYIKPCTAWAVGQQIQYLQK